MRKFLLITLAVLCLFLTGCSNEYAKEEYYSDEKIAWEGDRFSKEAAVLSGNTGENISFSAGRFDGRQTLTIRHADEEKDVRVAISLSLEKGQAKVVLVDPEKNIQTLMECSAAMKMTGSTTATMHFTEGKNRIKIVGYGCEGLELKLEIL